MSIYRFLLFMFPCFSWASQVSYHMFDEAASVPVVCTNVENKKDLESKMADCNKKFLQTPGTQLSWMAEQLTREYKKIFFNEEDPSSEPLLEETASSRCPSDVLSDRSRFETEALEIVNKMRGLPNAALSVEAMYETQGLYQDALLWAYVACKLGFEQGKSLASRLFLLLSC